MVESANTSQSSALSTIMKACSSEESSSPFETSIQGWDVLNDPADRPLANSAVSSP